MGEALERLFAITLLACIAIFCAMDARKNIRRGYIPGQMSFSPRVSQQTARADRPVNFWLGMGLKIFCAVSAALFLAV